MRRLYRERYQAGRGFTTDDVLDFVDDQVDPAEVRSFYERYVDGRDPLPYAEVLARVGLVYREETTTAPYLGVGTEIGESGEAVVTDVTPESAAEAAGLREGDVLVSIGDVPVDPATDWGAAFRARYAGAEGQPLALLVRRDGAEVTLPTTVRTRERTDIIIEPDPGAGERAQRLREGLLGR
jgi:predicted metalloprotease with PDZ domain